MAAPQNTLSAMTALTAAVPPPTALCYSSDTFVGDDVEEIATATFGEVLATATAVAALSPAAAGAIEEKLSPLTIFSPVVIASPLAAWLLFTVVLRMRWLPCLLG